MNLAPMHEAKHKHSTVDWARFNDSWIVLHSPESGPLQDPAHATSMKLV